jgi:uncharacterized Fe-S cluster protein YjdI
MSSPLRHPSDRAEPKAIEPERMQIQPRGANGLCRHCGRRLEGGELFFHEVCSPWNDPDLRSDD